MTKSPKSKPAGVQAPKLFVVNRSVVVVARGEQLPVLNTQSLEKFSIVHTNWGAVKSVQTPVFAQHVVDGALEITLTPDKAIFVDGQFRESPAKSTAYPSSLGFLEALSSGSLKACGVNVTLFLPRENSALVFAEEVFQVKPWERVGLKLEGASLTFAVLVGQTRASVTIAPGTAKNETKGVSTAGILATFNFHREVVDGEVSLVVAREHVKNHLEWEALAAKIFTRGFIEALK